MRCRSFSLDGGEARSGNCAPGASVTPNLFPLLGIRQPALGPALSEERRGPGTAGFETVGVLLSHRLWQQRFGGDAKVVGKSVIMNGRALTAIGVMPPGVRFPERDDLWVPYRPAGEGSRMQRGLATFAALRPGAIIGDAQQELSALASRLAEQHPD